MRMGGRRRASGRGSRRRCECRSGCPDGRGARRLRRPREHGAARCRQRRGHPRHPARRPVARMAAATGNGDPGALPALPADALEWSARRAEGRGRRLRIHHRCLGARRHQPARGEGGGHSDGHAARWADARSTGRRCGSEDRPRAPRDRRRRSAADGRIRGFRYDAGRRLGGRGGEPLRARRHRHRGHRLRAGPGHRLGSLRRLPPARRPDQPRQLRRPAVRPWRARDRRELRDLQPHRRERRHRLRGARERRRAGHRVAAHRRQGRARLAGGWRSSTSTRPWPRRWTSTKRRARWSHR